MNHLDLFSGIGGFTQAARSLGIETQQFVEINAFCQSFLAQRYPDVPIHDDVKTYEPQTFFDLITAGFPCQDISSSSSTRTGLNGDRSGLFYEVIRILRLFRSRFLVLENSAALLTHRGGRDMRIILTALARCGYDALWSVISACSVGAPHMRKRLFIVAYPNSLDVERMAFQQEFQKSLSAFSDHSRPELWASQPPDASLANGIQHRKEWMMALGNAVVPEVAKIPLTIVKAMNEAIATTQAKNDFTYEQTQRFKTNKNF